jgi:geranylgeranyl diphosphate synthase type II
MLTAPQCLAAIDSRLMCVIGDRSPLLEPVRYILEAGHAKRVRPIMTMLAAQLFAPQVTGQHLDAALAIEIFHNFTLIHDDIMDNADLRRGIPSLHNRFNRTTAILTGDALLVKAYQFLCQSPNAQKSLSLFHRTAIDVCEGQQLDMDYESLAVVTQSQYFEMIGKKTAALMAASCAIGALTANADDRNVDLMYDFGYNLGITFQLQDDYLDAYGTASFGKTIGGDILQGKKTALFTYAYQNLHPQRKQLFLNAYSDSTLSDAMKIEEVMVFYDEAQVERYTQDAVNSYYDESMRSLQKTTAPDDAKQELARFAQKFLGRET